MKRVQASRTILKNAQKYFLNADITENNELGKPYTKDPDYIFRGMWPSKKDWLVESKTGEYFLTEILTSIENPKKSKSTDSDLPKVKREINLVQISDLNYDPSIFNAMKTNTPMDFMFSTKGGIMPATNYMVVGDPGIGKSTQTLDLLAKIVKVDPNIKILFISGEMNEIDMYDYVLRFPEFGKIPTLFLCDYLEDNPMEIIEQTYQMGFDLILIDSFVEVQSTIAESCNITKSHAEKWMIDTMIKHNKGQNEGKHYTTFLFIQQITKGGDFVGSNKLKHNTTGTIELRYSSEFSGDRYAKVLKNRRGFLHEKIYFSIENELVKYDEKRLERDADIKKKMQDEKETLLNDEDKFKKMFFNARKEETEAIDED